MLRTGVQEKVFSQRVYNLIIGAFLIYGFIVNYLICRYFAIFSEWNSLLIFILYLVISFTGIYISENTSKPSTAFLGYNLVVIPIGVLLSIALKEVGSINIMNAILVTCSVVALFIFLSTLFPEFFSSLWLVVFISLLGVIIFELIFGLLGWIAPKVWDVICTCIFALCVGYFWAEAQKKKYTLLNAIVSCLGIYTSIINIFVRNIGSSTTNSSKQK